MTDWTKEEDEAFNAVEQQSNLGKHILKDMGGQPYHWEIDAIQAAIRMEREACENLCKWRTGIQQVDAAIETCANAIRARGQE